MKIIKILFLGIVLVLFNLTYLAAQTESDTVAITPDVGQPGGTLDITIDLAINSEDVGGLVIVFTIPPELDTTSGAWYTFSPGYGEALEAELETLVDKTDSLITVAMLGFTSFDDMILLGKIPSKSGELITFTFDVPESMEEGSYELTADEEANQIMSSELTGTPWTPTLEIGDVTISIIPDDNTLRLDASLTALSGGTLSLPVYIANKDIVSSGSFTVDYSPSVLTMTGVTAGVRAGGMSFDYSVADAPALLAAAGDKQATVTFTGGEIPTGGLGELCTLDFTVASVGAGALASVVLGNEELDDGALDVATSPQGTVELSFTYADTLAIDVQTGTADKGVPWEGTGIAPIIDGQLHLPIRLKNSVSVEVIEFYVTENPSDKLSLAEDPVMTLASTANWMYAGADSGSFVHVLAYAGSASDAISAGDDVVLHVVYDITLAAGETPGVDDPGIDITFALAGVKVVDSGGDYVGIEAGAAASATIDWRVPASGEGVGPGAALPKAFALTQNYPNPFNPSTTINYQIPEEAGNVSFTLSVYDIRGRLVKTLVKGMKGAGFYTAFWDGTDANGRQVSSGVYFYRFTSSKYSATRKMILLK
jgi:hypothetical protein